MSRVLIADDHAVVRAGYKQFLETPERKSGQHLSLENFGEDEFQQQCGHDRSDKMTDSLGTAPKRNLQEDGITNPKDGRGPLRKSDDSSTKLPPHTDESKQNRPH